MDANGKTAIVTLLANLLAERLTEDQLTKAAAILTQLGTTLGFIAAQRALDQAGGQSQITQPSAQTGRAGTESPPSQE